MKLTLAVVTLACILVINIDHAGAELSTSESTDAVTTATTSKDNNGSNQNGESHTTDAPIGGSQTTDAPTGSEDSASGLSAAVTTVMGSVAAIFVVKKIL